MSALSVLSMVPQLVVNRWLVVLIIVSIAFPVGREIREWFGAMKIWYSTNKEQGDIKVLEHLNRNDLT
jgi:hypothetical protein